MLIVHHRRNTLDLLAKTPISWGVEIDIRSYGDSIVVHHEPFVDAVRLEDWLKEYRHRLLILNIKEEGLEGRILQLMNEYGINRFFFLDQSFPFLIKTAKSGESRCAVRVSEYESIETALSLRGMVDWVWIDIFTAFPLSLADYTSLKNSSFKTCLVSPELQGQSVAEVLELKKYILAMRFRFDAVCTRLPQYWEAFEDPNLG